MVERNDFVAIHSAPSARGWSLQFVSFCCDFRHVCLRVLELGPVFLVHIWQLMGLCYDLLTRLKGTSSFA